MLAAYLCTVEHQNGDRKGGSRSENISLCIEELLLQIELLLHHKTKIVHLVIEHMLVS